jgi:hypothetical protein
MTTTTNPSILAPGKYAHEDPLASWNEGPTKQSIVTFVRGVTTVGDPQFVKPEERVAVFDNDGTLWCEQPIYFQFAFVLDRMKEGTLIVRQDPRILGDCHNPLAVFAKHVDER